MRKMFTVVGRASLVVAGVVAALTLGACSNDNTYTVDGKTILEVPVTVTPPAEAGKPAPQPIETKATCYFLEVDTDSSAGEEVGEGYHCVSKDEYEANTVGEEWVDANGNKKGRGTASDSTETQLCYNCVAPTPSPTGKP